MTAAADAPPGQPRCTAHATTGAAAAAADYLLFASGSAVRFYTAAGGSLAGPRLVSIGPATSEADVSRFLTELGRIVDRAAARAA